MVGTQGFEAVYGMRRSTFTYVCSLVRVSIFEDTMTRDHTFVDGRVLSLQDRVAVGLRMLNSSEPPEIIGSSLGVDESSVLLVTQRFVKAMLERARQCLRWPGSTEMEKIKCKCCGVLNTTHIMFGSKDRDHDNGILMQVVVDPHMRFTDFLFGPSASRNQSSFLHDSWLFKECEKGVLLNGSKLKLSFGEFIIGGALYPIRPWLLTPYQLDSDLSESDYKKEFNRRHSAATAVAQRALARFKDTWKCLLGEGWIPNNQNEMYWTIHACCLLHNIVIGMEEDGAVMPSDQEQYTTGQMRQIADEGAVKLMDALAQHLNESGVHKMAAEEEQKVPAASGSGDENSELTSRSIPMAKSSSRKAESARRGLLARKIR